MKTILLVEDDYDLRHGMAEVLTDAGHEVRAAANGAEALDLLTEGGPPRLILLDLMMPVMDGWQFRLKQLEDPALAGIPLVVVTAIPEVADDMGCLEGAQLLAKPFDADGLLAAVERGARELAPAARA